MQLPPRLCLALMCFSDALHYMAQDSTKTLERKILLSGADANMADDAPDVSHCQHSDEAAFWEEELQYGLIRVEFDPVKLGQPEPQELQCEHTGGPHLEHEQRRAASWIPGIALESGRPCNGLGPPLQRTRPALATDPARPCNGPGPPLQQTRPSLATDPARQRIWT